MVDPHENQPNDEIDRAWPIALGLLYLLAGTLAAVLAVEVAKALGSDPQGQRVVAFACVGSALLLLLSNNRVREGGPITVIATLIGGSAAAVAALSYVGPIEAEPQRGCINSDGPFDVTVSGETTVLFSQASSTSQPKGLLLLGCQLKAEGYCIGTVHRDAIEEQVIDTRWLILSEDQGLIPAGRTAGHVPADARKACPGGVPPPDKLNFSAAVLDVSKATVAVQAVAPRAAFIGFAFKLPSNRWRRLGWDKTPEDSQPLNAPAPAEATPGLEIAAVACVAFRHSSGPVRYAKLGRGTTSPTELPAVKQPTSARPEHAACDAAIPPPGA